MTERPILFSAPMVRAILVGTKTQTRRVVKWRDTAPGLNLSFSGLSACAYPNGWVLESRSRTSSEFRSGLTRCPYGQPGDRMWVRETWGFNPDFPGVISQAQYRADPGYGSKFDDVQWKPSIHMPRAACRLKLDITGVRVERLQDISEADALAEGIVQLKDGGYGLPAGEHYHSADPRQSYLSLWEAINGPGSVEANPWVWCVEFARVA